MSDINEGSNFADGNFSEYIAGERAMSGRRCTGTLLASTGCSPTRLLDTMRHRVPCSPNFVAARFDGTEDCL